MGRIQSNIGLTTGIDIQSTVNQLIAISKQPIDRLQTRIKGYQSQQVAINELTALVIGVQLQTDKLGKVAGLTNTTAASSKSASVSVTTSGTPSVGNYSIQTIQTAQTATASSTPFTSESDVLQAGDFVVRSGGFVDGSSSLEDLRGGAGIARGKIRITDRSGVSKEIDLRFTTNTDDILKTINSTSGLRVNAKVSGDRIVLSDLTGQTISKLAVEEVGDGRTATDLGLSGISVVADTATGDDIVFVGNNTRLSTLRDGRGIAFATGTDLNVTLKDGTAFSIDVNSTKSPTTLGQLVTAINSKDSTKLEARINADGSGLELIDKTTGSTAFAATGKLADQLGFTGRNGATGTIQGTRIQGTLSGPLLSALKGGQGIGTPGQISITNRRGDVSTVNLSGAVGLKDVVDRINNNANGVTASLNRSRTGIVLQDVTGSTVSNLIVVDGDANNSATNLKIAANTAQNSVDSGSLGLQYVSEATSLASLNQGRGIRLGSFTITNSAGVSTGVNLSQLNAKTVGDVVQAINNTNINVQARLNDNGDGFVLVDTSNGSGTLQAADSLGNNAAADLGISGSAKSLTSPVRQEIDGSQTFKLSLAGTETLAQFVEKVNQSNGPLTASLLNSGPNTVRVLFTSKASGEIGRVVAEGDGIGVGVNSSGSGRDAIISVGSAGDNGGTLVRSSTSTFSNAINGLDLKINDLSPDPVQITVSSSNSTIENNLQLFVDQYNRVRDKVDKETIFDPTSKVSGQLFGSNETLRTEQALSRFINQRTFSSGKIQSLEQLGVSLDDKGKLKLDKTKLSKALAANPTDVQEFFVADKTGFSVRAKVVLDNLVGVKNSVLVNRSQSLQRQIETSTDRVTFLNLRLETERAKLTKQFYDTETNIAKIKSNGNALNQLGITK
jgi:flagellar hook-associated protein 2